MKRHGEKVDGHAANRIIYNPVEQFHIDGVNIIIIIILLLLAVVVLALLLMKVALQG